MNPSTEMMIFYFQWMFFLTLPLLTAVLPQIPIKTAARDAKTANAAANVAAATQALPDRRDLWVPEEYPDLRAFPDQLELWDPRDMLDLPAPPEILVPPAPPA